MESISRLSSMLETARDLTLEAAQSATSARGFKSSSSMRDLSATQLKRLLDSRNDREVLDGLRRVISMMYRSQPCLPYFSSVIKNVASPNIEIKKLVYIYLLHHAEHEPDLALLSINTIQKALTDQNLQVRAMALRVMSGIRVPVISQIVSLGIKKGCADMSPYVRKAAALAIPKCYRLDPNTLPQLLEYLAVLLGDKQYYVVGAAVISFMEVCPDMIDLIHKHYRALTRKLVDMDEWGQLATLRLMIVYARKCFPRRTRRTTKAGKGFYGDEVTDEGDVGDEIQVLDPDLELLLNACKPLLQSRNSAVVVAVARCYFYLGTSQHMDSAIGPLISLLRSPQDIQQIALYNVVSVCLVRPQSFVRYATHFLIRASDPPCVWRLKLEILTIIFPLCDMHLKGIILNELEHFSQGFDQGLVRESVRAIGRCAQNDSSTTPRCLRLLLKQMSSPDGNLVAESLTVIRHLIQQDPSAHTKTVIHLAKSLDTATNPQARASIIWLVGEFAGVDGDNNIAADVLRLLAKGFSSETEPAKLQIVLLAAKVYVHHLNRTQPSIQSQKELASAAAWGKVTNSESDAGLSDGTNILESGYQTGGLTENEKEHPIVVLWRYILLLARYDTSYDLRDRARLYKALLAVPSSIQLASLLLLAPKPVPHTPSPSEGRRGFTLGSASMVIGEEGGSHGLKGYEVLPEWVEEGHEPDPVLREEENAKIEYGERRNVPAVERLDSVLKEGTRVGHAPGRGMNNPYSGGKEKTLNDWLAEDEEEDGEDGSEESTEEETDDEGSEYEESEEEEEHDSLVK